MTSWCARGLSHPDAVTVGPLGTVGALRGRALLRRLGLLRRRAGGSAHATECERRVHERRHGLAVADLAVPHHPHHLGPGHRADAADAFLGLVVVGVHTPEFDFEADPANVQAAIRRLGISYPVAMDNHAGTWNAWHNQFWPAEYLVDQNGRLIGHHYGEGAYDVMENAVRVLLGLGPLPTGDAATGHTPAPGETPELHLGSATQSGLDDAEARNGGNGMHRFSASGGPAANHYVLDGRWEITDEYARLAGSEGDIKLRFKAAKVYVVASAAQPVTLQVTVDGKPQPAVTVQGSQLYALYDGAADGEHVLVLHVPQSGVQVYSFTFG